MKHKQNQQGIVHFYLLIILVIIIVAGAGWLVLSRQKNTDTNQDATASVPNLAKIEEPTKVSEEPKEADSPDTLSSPEKVTSADNKTYFIYGAPTGQNNKDVKRVIISLPGHGTTADEGYNAWMGHIEDGQYALAEFNWWRGTGEKKTDYYDPTAVVLQVRAFLNQEGYDNDDIVVLHGFSRGSANTYAVIAQDRLQRGAVFDAVISNAGKYQSDFPLADTALTDQKISELFNGMPWVLACGGKDENPDRDGCPGMEETKTFLVAHKANVLGIVTDPNKGHGAFHMSELGLPKQALALIDEAM